MTNTSKIPPELLERVPLMKDEYMEMYTALLESEHAPKWNYVCGDRLRESDLPYLNEFYEDLHKNRTARTDTPPEFIYEWIDKLKEDVLLFKDNIGSLDIRKDFSKIQCSNREDIAARLERVVPLSISLDRLVNYATSGTTGHPIVTPNRPDSVGCYNALILFALEKHGVKPNFTKDNVSCFLICAQKDTAVYSTVLPVLNGTGFAKLNLNPASWNKETDFIYYMDQFQPLFLTGDPFSFSELLKYHFKHKPQALVSTSMALTDSLRNELEAKFQCPVIDFLSMNETGAIAYSCPLHKDRLHLLPHDLHIEVTDENGSILEEGNKGELTVTGGRNPFIPLLRYKTNDYGRLKFAKCECGEVMPTIYDLETRKPVMFRTGTNSFVNPVDISRVMRNYPIVQHQFIQKKDLSCELRVKLFYEIDENKKENFTRDILKLFDDTITLNVFYNLDIQGNSGKIVSYISEI